MTLQDILNHVLTESEPLVLTMAANEYATLRVSLLRKYKTYRELCVDVGMDQYDDKFVMCSYDKDSLLATFKLEHKSQGRRVPRNYMVAKL